MRPARILVVDDEPGMLRAVERVLSDDHQVVATRLAREALAIADQFQPELAIVDIRMPDLDGFELMAQLKSRFPAIDVIPVTADFARPFSLPGGIDNLPKLGFFPGSTIGNFVPWSATDLLRQFRALLGAGSQLLIGMDRVKPVGRLIAAYDDPEGVTAQFTLNLLTRINRELDADIPVEAFRHEARWNDILSRIEIHLVATRDVAFTVAGKTFRFASGASIHAENSHKYGQRGGRVLLLAGGWTPVAEWTDPARDFAVILAEAQPQRFAP